MNKYFKFTSLVLSIVLCFTAVALAQETTGSIQGTVNDQAGAAIPGATVKITSTGSTVGFSRTVTTNDNGEYTAPSVPAGSYKVAVTATGFKSATRNVNVNLGRTSVASFNVEVGDVGVTVDVTTDGAATIDPGDTKIDTNIGKQLIDDLPKGTTFGSLLKIAPNVRPEALSAGFQIDGASGAENVFVVDGQEVTNFRTGQLNSNNNLPFELLQEVQIKSTGFEAEYGGATGGVINVVTVGGNDQLRGTFGASFRPEKWQGDPNVVLNRFNTTATPEYFQPPKAGGVDFFPVASLSGPIVKEKLWFSAIYAPQIVDRTQTIDYFGNSVNGNPGDPNGRFVNETITYDTNVRTEAAFFRLDAQPVQQLRVYGTFLYNPIIQEGVLPGNAEGLNGGPQDLSNIGLGRGSALLAQRGGRQNSNAVNGQATWTPTDWVVLNFRAGRSFLNEKLNSYGLPRIQRTICSTFFGVNTAICTPGQNVSSNFNIDFDVSTRTTFDADASLVGIQAGGSHNFKFGYQYNGLFNTVDEGYRNEGVVVLYPNRPFEALIGLPSSPDNIGSGFLQRFAAEGEASSDNHALFAQDSWTINNRLTLNLGVRIENEIVPNFGGGNTEELKFGWGDKIAPRIGVAFDLTGDGKTKLFGSYGWFYDRFKYELPRGLFGGNFFRRDYFQIRTSYGADGSNYTVATITGGAPDPVGGTCPIVGGPGFSECQFDFRIPVNSADADIFQTGGVDPDLKAARQSEYTIGLERQLANNFLLSARYTHKQIDRAIEDVGVFNDQGSEAYIIGNPGLGLTCDINTSAGYPCTKAERTYDAFEIRVDKRAADYFFNASYTLSRLFGNYSGLASSDEFGRSSPNVNRFFDLPFLGYNANGEPDNGRLATDRPHVFKAYGGYTFDWADDGINRTTISSFTTLQSGSPVTTIYSLYNVSTAVLFGRGDLGRTEIFSETDLNVSHKYKFGRDARFTLEPFIEIRNLFDERNEIARQTTISSTNFTASTLRANGCTTCGLPTDSGGVQETAVFNTIFNGGGIQQFVVNAVGNGRNDYDFANTFQVGRDVRFGFRLIF